MSEIRQILGVSVCCVCGKIPNYEIRSDAGDDNQRMWRIEYCCSECIKTVFTREDDDYGCIKVDSLPPSEAST